MRSLDLLVPFTYAFERLERKLERKLERARHRPWAAQDTVYRFGVIRLGVADGYLHPVLPRGLADADNLARREAYEKEPPPVDGGSLG